MTTLKSFEVLNFAMDGFIRGNGNFESSVVINAAIEELEQCESFQQCFAIPLQHKLFSMETALKWVLFLTVIPDKIIEQESEDEEFAKQLDEFNTFKEFSSSDALKLIASVYDLGIQDAILSHLDDGSDSDSDDGDDDGDDDSDSDEESVSKDV
jgi:hypothetical protein